MTQIKIVRGLMSEIEGLVNLALQQLHHEGCIITNMELYWVDDKTNEHVVVITYKEPIEV